MGANASSQPSGVVASELSLVDGAQRVSVPFGSGNEYICPNCEQRIPPLRIVFLGKPPKYAHLMNDVARCSWCKFIFSYKVEATVLRR